jgi:hypothetical protein
LACVAMRSSLRVSVGGEGRDDIMKPEKGGMEEVMIDERQKEVDDLKIFECTV